MWYNFLIMNGHMISIDITHVTDLPRLIREVKQTKTPRKLTEGTETVAILMPIADSSLSSKRRAKTQAKYEAFLSAAGSWKDVDVEKLKADIYASRRLSTTRPAIEL
jgi:hypothetical protein